MDNTYLLYLQKIPNTSWIIETISEKFDDAIDMLTTNSVIYGGAVRDCLAGKKLLGDLDILVPYEEYHSLTNRFMTNPKWVLTKRNKQSSTYKMAIVNNKQLFGLPYFTSFKTLDNREVQIIPLPSTNNNTIFQTITHFVKQVDIVCCGVILTNEGKAFEVVPNAYKDCKKNILRLNNLLNVTNLKHFQQRVKKLVLRGWINEMNFNQIIKNVNNRSQNKKTTKKLYKNQAPIPKY